MNDESVLKMRGMLHIDDKLLRDIKAEIENQKQWAEKNNRTIGQGWQRVEALIDKRFLRKAEMFKREISNTDKLEVFHDIGGRYEKEPEKDSPKRANVRF